MNVRISSRFLALWFAVAGSVAFGTQAAERKPNIIHIVSDELGYYELSCMGNPHLKTPNIDRMAAEGVRFTQALAGSSVCAPTRACLMTGKHSGHTSVRSNGGGTPLREGEETIASVLKRAGYATGGFGKWGCGGRGSTGVPEKHGFDVFIGYYDQVHAHSYYPAYIIRNSEELPLPGNTGGRSGQTYSHYVIFDEAIQFIRANQDRPFFCYLPITPPHGWFDIPDSDPAWTLFKDKNWPEDAKRYAAMVHMVDRQAGQVFDLIKELGLDQQTIVFFSGDNGGADYFPSKETPRGFHSANVDPKTGAFFRGKKGTLYEGGLRIPMIVRWPGKIQSSRVSDLLWYFPDMLPTLAELADAPAPADIDGISILPELLGETAAGRPQNHHDFLYWELGLQTAVRMGHWKAVRPRPNQPWELYDLARDIGEQNNVATTHSSVLSKLTAFAQKAHEPVQEGTFHETTLHERDRRAKFGVSEPAWRRLPLIKNGKVEPGWVHVGWGGFAVDDGALRTECDPKGLGLLVYEKERFGNCQIRVVFKSKDAKSNAGVYVRLADGILDQVGKPGAAFDRDASGRISKESMKRVQASAEREEGPWFAVHHGYEVQIAGAADPWHRTGSIYSLARATDASEKAPGEWKTMIITLEGNRILVDLDGKHITSLDPGSPDVPPRRQWHEPKREPKRPQAGYIGLQNHDPGDVVWFKEVSVRPLASSALR